MNRTIPLILFLSLIAALPVPSLEATAPGSSVPPVIAYVENGINPYHMAFREPSWTAHPSTYIPGYPEDARPFPITLDALTFEEAWEADQDLWDSIVPEQLYYMPGTRIVGAILVTDSQNQVGQSSFYDSSTTSHSTKVVDAGSGSYSGTASHSAIVTVTGAGSAFGMRWVADQEWIDIVSTSLGCIGAVVGIPPGIQSGVEVLGWEPDFPSPAESSYRITEGGRLAVSGAGNGIGTSATCDFPGPPWVMTVGRVTGNGSVQYPHFQANDYWPFDLAGSEWAFAAVKDSFTETEHVIGSSMSGPRIAGYAARLITEARERLGDEAGFRDGAFARAGPNVVLPETGPLADGSLDRTELEDLLRKNAHYYPLGAEQWTDTEIPPESQYFFKAYGGFLEPSYEQSRQVLLGQIPMPERPQDDAWHTRLDALLALYWEPLACRAVSDADLPSECWTDPANRSWDQLLDTI